MTAIHLVPQVDLLSEEYVLVQAWKKTASYIRSHNWYSDTLELDRAAVNLSRYLAELREQLKALDQWSDDPLRIVPAPKSHRWLVNKESKLWEPVKSRQKGQEAVQIRPLAHVSLKDQIAATAVMLCLADRVETLQGDPGVSLADRAKRARVTSYGNRLYCDVKGVQLRHRWGSQKLYRAYFVDYRRFLLRPEIAAEAVEVSDGGRVVIVHSDLRQFYDRVSPDLLSRKIGALRQPGDDSGFYDFVGRLLNWEWHKRDSRDVAGYARQAGLSDFSNVALPQGLVAAGFFANVVLLDFDQALRATLTEELEPGVCVEDVSRYVDDLRIVLRVDTDKSLPDIERLVFEWLQRLLGQHAAGLEPSRKKTTAAGFRGDERPLVRQSRKMARVQSAISGGFDAIGGEEILDAVQGLIRSQERYSTQQPEEQGWSFSPIPDVRDATVARFAAGRFRITYRSLRPLLADREDSEIGGDRKADRPPAGTTRVVRTQDDLDDEARAFALGLVETWVEDPSNVRLLRIGLDLWPAEDLLKGVLGLLRPFTQKGAPRGAPRRVAWYCLAELFRAGATETGIIENGESLPKDVDISAYGAVLRHEAVQLAKLPPSTLPWYLKQQVLLFLAASDATEAPVVRSGRNPETKHYRDLIRFLNGEGSDGLTGADFAIFAILARRSFRGQAAALRLIEADLSPRRFQQIAERDPSFALEIVGAMPELLTQVSPRLRDDLCLNLTQETDTNRVSLAMAVLRGEANGPIRNEPTILRFALRFLKEWRASNETSAITPSDVLLKLRATDGPFCEIDAVTIAASRVTPSGSLYDPPPWCPSGERWRFQLGYLLRFILTARQDFTRPVRPVHWKEETATYRAPESHWYQRIYGLFSGHSAFGDDWLPISDWTERLLFALLRWPGCPTSEFSVHHAASLSDVIAAIEQRIQEHADRQRDTSGVLMLTLDAPLPDSRTATRPLRACVVQTVTPTVGDFKSNLSDITLSDPSIRKRHRNHLSAAIAAIERMLDLRATHTGEERRLDWLILPELSVHPDDVQTHLVPFARAHKCIVLAGLVYEELFDAQPLINSGIWVIPFWSPEYGLQILTRRQGKQNLAPEEQLLNSSAAVVAGFRPCQWLVGYQWSRDPGAEPLWLTASICYDATDLALAADLRSRSDVFAIPALNKDVGTFDQMALALHYHMFQMVIVANNGQYGGSNAYAPYRDAFQKQVFHLHGQPQASIAFLEINDIGEFLERKASAKNQSVSLTDAITKPLWKYPPAGL